LSKLIFLKLAESEVKTPDLLEFFLFHKTHIGLIEGLLSSDANRANPESETTQLH